jgi:hypothetical protein
MLSFGADDLDAHHRLHGAQAGLLGASWNASEAGDLEGHFRRVDVVVRTVDQLDAHVVDRVAGEDAARERFLDALVDRLDELARESTPPTILFSNCSRLPGSREPGDPRVAELAAAAGLTLEEALAARRGLVSVSL